ncbi:MAG: DUF5908 family protein [Bacteroidota bacterium]
MSIEIRELIIKVKIGESEPKSEKAVDMVAIRQFLQKECKKEVKKQLNRIKGR